MALSAPQSLRPAHGQPRGALLSLFLHNASQYLAHCEWLVFPLLPSSFTVSSGFLPYMGAEEGGEVQTYPHT